MLSGDYPSPMQPHPSGTARRCLSLPLVNSVASAVTELCHCQTTEVKSLGKPPYWRLGMDEATCLLAFFFQERRALRSCFQSRAGEGLSSGTHCWREISFSLGTPLDLEFPNSLPGVGQAVLWE